jgi:DNA modification methylase
MKKIDPKSIDLILCDLPFNMTHLKWDILIPFDQLWQQYKRIIKDRGAIVLNSKQPFTSSLIMSNPKMFKYELIWKKKQATNPLLCKKRPMSIHESICVFYKKQPKYNYEQMMTEGKPYKGFHSERKKIGEVYNNLNSIHKENKGTRYPISILEYAREYGLHTTQKPLQMGIDMIRLYTDEGDIVLDNACGSGTYLLSAKLTGRNYIGFENDKKYYDIAVKRLKD